MRLILGEIIKANKLFGFIKNGDKIGVGLSGGKDSSILLLALNLYKDYVKRKFNWDIEIYAVHVVLNFYNIDYTEYKKWLSDNKLHVEFIDSNIGEILKQKAKNSKVICSLCAKLKKAIIVNKAKELGINKLATGHHFDDAVETLVMNMFGSGRISTFRVSTHFDRNNVYLIRPLILCNEKKLEQLSKKLNIPVIKNSCPNETSTKRYFVKMWLENEVYSNKLFGKKPYESLKTAMLNKKNFNLWFEELKEDKQ